MLLLIASTISSSIPPCNCLQNNQSGAETIASAPLHEWDFSRLWRHAPGVVDVIFSRQQKLRHGHDLIPLLQQVLNDPRQGLRRVLGGVVEQYDAPIRDFGRDALVDVVRAQILPVQGIAFPYNRKALVSGRLPASIGQARIV